MKKKSNKARKNSMFFATPLIWSALGLGVSVVSAATTWLVKDQTQAVVRSVLPPVTGAATGYLIANQAKLDQNAKLAASLIGGALGYYINVMVTEQKKNTECSWWNPLCYLAKSAPSGLFQLSDEKRTLLDQAAAVQQEPK